MMDNAYGFNPNLPINNMDYVTLDQIRQALASNPNGGALKQYYDYVLFDSFVFGPGVALPSTKIQFFQNKTGNMQQIVGTNSLYNKQDNDTNMQNSGQLPQGQFFVFNSIQVLFNLTGNCPAINTTAGNQQLDRPITSGLFTANINSAFSDLRSFMQLGSGTFMIGNRPFINAPLFCYPTQFGVWGYGFAVGATTGQAQLVDSTANNGPGVPLQLQSPLLLVNGKNFEFDVTFPYSFTTPANAYLQMYCCLVGTIYDSIS